MSSYYGGKEYEGVFAIENDRLMFGPFETKSDAVEFAMKELETPWTLHDMLTPKRALEP